MNVVTNIHNALVYDFGSHSIRFGFGGDEMPQKCVSSSSVQRMKDGDFHIQFGESWLQRDLPGMDVKQMIDETGVIADNDILISFLDWTFECLAIEDPLEHPVLFNQPSVLALYPDLFNKWRSSVARCVFEFANHQALCLQHDSSLACYSHCMHTGLVVDYGWSCCRVVPVLEGHPLKNSIKKHPIGGLELTNLLNNKMTENGKPIRTNFDPKPNDMISSIFSKKKTYVSTQSQINHCRRTVLNDMIRGHLKYNVIPNENDEDIVDYVYSMPGQETVEIKDEIISLSDMLWKPDENVPQTCTPLPQLMTDSITSLPQEMQNQMWENIITSGGFSTLAGFNERLESELVQMTPQNKKVHVVSPVAKSASGSRCVWTGGSIVASLPSFKDMCITSAEWNEVGENILRIKCL